MTQPPLRVTVFGEYGAQNFGNEATLASFLTDLAVVEPTAAVTVVGSDPERVRADHGVAAVAMVAPWRPRVRRVGRLLDLAWLARQAARADLVVLPGTGIVEGIGRQATGIALSLCAMTWSARLLGRGVLGLTIGVEADGSRAVRRLHARTLRSLTWLSVRDASSLAAARALVPGLTCPVLPDPVLTRAPEEPTGEPTGETVVRDEVGVGVMSYFGRSGRPEQAMPEHVRYVEQMVELVARLVAAGHTVRLLHGDAADAPVVERVRAGVLGRLPDGSAPGRVVASPLGGVDDVQRVARGLRVLVAPRYHNLVGALTVATPCIAVAYGDKHRSLMREVGTPELCHDIEALDVDALVAQVEQVAGEWAAYSARVAAVLTRMRGTDEARLAQVRRAVEGSRRGARRLGPVPEPAGQA